MAHNYRSRTVRFVRSARKHRIGVAHALHVMYAVEPLRVPADARHDERLRWEGPDDRGVGLEIIAVVLPDLLLVVHVMPLIYRRKGTGG